MIWIVLFAASAFFVIYSYLLYPMLLRVLGYCKIEHPYANPKSISKGELIQNSDCPEVVIYMAVYNEEKVLKEKLESIFNSDYPLEKLTVLVGSDASSDLTDSILATYANKYPQLKWERFEGRWGKIKIVNQLVEQNQALLHSHGESVMVFTDANVFFEEKMLKALVSPLKRPIIGLVGARVLNTKVKKLGIAQQEKWYIQHENSIKSLEGSLWGTMMGAFGACFAMKAKLFSKVPDNFVVDDFYLTMNCLDRGYKAIEASNAICFEDVSTELSEEFRRKKRISSGNFQNLQHFSQLLLPSRGAIAFSFWSHKVLRWFSPFFLILALFSSAVLANQYPIFKLGFYLQLLLMISPLIDYFVQKLGLNWRLLRFVAYFYAMNAALLVGFFRFTKGVDSNVWKPTKRV